jgi:hypothetical protein
MFLPSLSLSVKSGNHIFGSSLSSYRAFKTSLGLSFGSVF